MESIFVFTPECTEILMNAYMDNYEDFQKTRSNKIEKTKLLKKFGEKLKGIKVELKVEVYERKIKEETQKVIKHIRNRQVEILCGKKTAVKHLLPYQRRLKRILVEEQMKQTKLMHNKINKEYLVLEEMFLQETESFVLKPTERRKRREPSPDLEIIEETDNQKTEASKLETATSDDSDVKIIEEIDNQKAESTSSVLSTISETSDVQIIEVEEPVLKKRKIPDCTETVALPKHLEDFLQTVREKIRKDKMVLMQSYEGNPSTSSEDISTAEVSIPGLNTILQSYADYQRSQVKDILAGNLSGTCSSQKNLMHNPYMNLFSTNEPEETKKEKPPEKIWKTPLYPIPLKKTFWRIPERMITVISPPDVDPLKEFARSIQIERVEYFSTEFWTYFVYFLLEKALRPQNQ